MDVVNINKEAVRLTPERHELEEHDEAKLRAILEKVKHSYNRPPLEERIARKAALLLYGIAQSQCFHDGNKRTALIACASFLKRNSHSIHLEDKELLTSLDKVAIFCRNLKELYPIVKRLIGNVQNLQ